MPHVLQIAFKRCAVGHRENPVVPFFPALAGLKNFEHPDRFTAEDQAGIGRGVVDHKHVERIAVFRPGRGDKPPIVRICQPSQ
jgi:hypothetical protein